MANVIGLKSNLLELFQNVNKVALESVSAPVTPLYPELYPGTPVKLSNKSLSSGTKVVANKLSELLSNGLFNDGSDFGRAMGTFFSLGVSSAGQTIADNLIKGNNLMYGLKEDLGNSLAGTGVGLAALGIGKGINSLGGDSMLSRGLGQGVATGLGTIGGRLVTNGTKNLFGSAKSIFSAVDSMKKAKDATEAAKFASKASAINPYALGMSVAGSALGTAFGPSKEYGGKYGNITKTMDTVYDTISSAANFIPGAGLFVSGAMILNKGLSNLFGSTSGMTKQDAFLGSAFMPAPVKWLNMAGANTTGTFNNLSWQNSEKINSFIGNAFGNLGDRFDKARNEAGKVWGTTSQKEYREAQDNINFSNYAWDRALTMADLNELLNIGSLYMTSINNLRYASNIQGNNRNLVGRGKQGMKIFNNATNHNIGMRLLSAAALIDNKAMILSAQGGTKVTRPPRMRAHRKGDESRGLTPEEQEWWKLHEEEQKRLLEEDAARKQKQREEVADKFNQQVSTVMGAMTLQANETPFTGQEYQQAAENLRQEKVEKFHEAEKIGEAAMMADLAVSAAPLLLRGFRWTFNKAGLLVKIPLEKTNLFLTSPYTGKWTQFGNREYRFKPGYVGMNGVPVESRTLKITAENAASITPEQWTAAQDAAITRGDMAEALRLRDLHANIYGDPIVSYHGQTMPNNMYIQRGLNPYNDKRDYGFYSSSSNDVANTYNFIEGSPTFKLYTHFNKPYIINANKANAGKTLTDRTYLQKSKEGYDGVIIKDVYDVGFRRNRLNGTSGLADDIIATPGRSKLADAVTYDDNGIRIPLGERDSKLNDIRYSWLPWFLGGSTAATLYNTNK